MNQPINHDILEVNKYIFLSLVGTGEYQKSPYLRPENIARVRALVLSIAGDLDKADSGVIDSAPVPGS